MTRLFLVLVLIAIAAGPVFAAEQTFDVGRIVIIDAKEGFVIAEFPNGQRVDSFGRPQFPA